jgi:hypothetical protein
MTRTLITMVLAGSAVLGAVQLATAQTTSASGSSKTMKALLEEGFEIKAAAPNGSRYVVFMQKDKAAYACEFVTVTNSRCGAIN